MQDESLDLSFLSHIREVTGYVLISHVDVARIVLPSLQIIRGRTLFKLNVQDDQFALMVTLSKMHNLEMPALRGKEGRNEGQGFPLPIMRARRGIFLYCRFVRTSTEDASAAVKAHLRSSLSRIAP